MVESNRPLFDSFRDLHARYGLEEESLQEEFNREGEKVLEVVREWENKLCSHSEKSGYGSYTTSLAEKFQGEVKKMFPLIDRVGLITKRFSIKKIRLN